MSQEASSECPPDLATQLVNILYSNTNLNYDVCATNLAEVFSHLSLRLPHLSGLTQPLVDAMKASVSDEHVNPDLGKLEHNLTYLKEINDFLQSGEKNFYECNHQIEAALDESTLLLTRQSNDQIFKNVLLKNRQSIFNLFEIWQIATNKIIKNKMTRFFNICFKSDPFLVCLLFENTNICSELCCSITESISLDDSLSLFNSLKSLITIIVNCRLVPLSFSEYLKNSNFLQVLFDTIESEKSFLFTKLSEIDEDQKGMHRSSSQYQQGKSSQPEATIMDLLISLVLALNLKFFLPEDNLVAYHLVSDQERIQTHKLLGETILNHFNFEFDPLLEYQLKVNLGGVTVVGGATCCGESESVPELYYVNSTLKFISDMFSYEHTRESTSIFYSNDFNVIIDIIIRKLTNLSSNDQIRVEYLSLIQLILKNSSYLKSPDGSIYRKEDLSACFNTILNEKDADTIDQDIIRIIVAEHEQFKASS